MRRYVFAGMAIFFVCFVSIFVLETLIRAPIYATYYRLFDYSQPIEYDLGYGYYVSAPIDEITKSQSTDIQQAAKPFLEELEKKSDYELIILKAADDVCNVGAVSCGIIDSKTAKRYVEAMYARTRFLAARADQRFYNKLALAGLVIALFSLVLGILQLRFKRHT